MGKKKVGGDTETEDKSRPKVFDDFAATIFDAAFITDSESKIISVSPAFDLGFGGISEGNFIALTGQPKVGKSLLSLAIAARAQRQEYANPKLCPNGRMVAFFNIEHRIRKRDLEGVKGLDLSPEKFKIIQSSEGNILTSEGWCNRIERFLNECPGSVCIIDSFSMLSSQAEQAADMGFQDRGKSHGIISQLCRRIAPILALNKCIVIGITHILANTSGYGAATIEKTANALRYAEDLKAFAKTVTPWRTGTNEKSPQIGQKVEWQVLFSSLCPPGAKFTSHIRYNYGLDVYSELAEIAEQFGLISKGGAWYKLTFLHDESIPKLNGLEQVRDVLENNPEWYNELRKQVYEMIGYEYLL